MKYKTYSIKEVAELDRESRNLVSIFSAARMKIGLPLAKILKEFEYNKLYLKLDSDSYPTFVQYIKSLNANYKTIREIMGLYETFVLAAGMSIDELSTIPYHKLTVIKPMLFSKVEGEYKLIKSKDELKKWIADVKSEISVDDLRQLRREEEIGEHKHEFFIMHVCKHCKLKEYINEGNKQKRN